MVGFLLRSCRGQFESDHEADGETDKQYLSGMLGIPSWQVFDITYLYRKKTLIWRRRARSRIFRRVRFVLAISIIQYKSYVARTNSRTREWKANLLPTAVWPPASVKSARRSRAISWEQPESWCSTLLF